MNQKEIKEVRKMFVKGNTVNFRFDKLYKDIQEIALYKIIPTPFGNYNNKYNSEEFNNSVIMFSYMNHIVKDKNLHTIFNTNDYCLYLHKNKDFIKAINTVIIRLKNNCNYIVINNEYIKRDIKCLIDFGIIATTNLSNLFIVNHNFIFRGDPNIVDYFYTLFYSDNYAIKKSYININNYLDDEKINLSKCYIDDNIIKSIYDKFLIKDNDTIEYRNKVADTYIKYYDINLINPNINFII